MSVAVATDDDTRRAVTVTRTVRVPAPPAALWPLLADTDRLNREMGLPPAEYHYQPRPEGGSLLGARLTMYGITTRFEEAPYRWIEPKEWGVRRDFAAGPVRWYDLLITLAAVGNGGAEVTVRLTVAPRGGAYNVPFAHFAARDNAGRIIRACRGFARFLSGVAPDPYPRHGAFPVADAARMRAAEHRLTERGVEPALARRLAAHLASAPPEDVIALRPFALADAWDTPRPDTLRACLRAVEAGMLELRWRVLCPACRGPGPTVNGLGELADRCGQDGAGAHCPSCDLRFGPEFDRSVEVCFSVAPSVRAAQGAGRATYCIGGPRRSPHLAAQIPLAAGQTMAVTPGLPPGEYLLASPQAAGASVPFRVGEAGEDSGGAAAVVVVSADAGRGAAFARPAPGGVLPGGDAGWRFENRAPFPVTVRVERTGWRSDVATAALVTSLQEFRDRFGSEVLAPGSEVAVRQVTILFSDLKGSTGMYAARGDAPSYATVRRHFALMRAAIGRHDGAVIKTIGDAVMAVFSDPAAAVAAALEAQRESARDPEGLVVKLGLNAGGALAVNTNDLLDYFGQTVNVAARVQALSVGGDVVLPASLAEDARIGALLADGAVRAEPFTVSLRGTDGDTPLLRLWPVPATVTSPPPGSIMGVKEP